MDIALNYEELLTYAQRHKETLLSMEAQQAFLDKVSRAIKPIHANDPGIKPYVDKINEFISEADHTALSEGALDELLAQIKTVQLMGLELSRSEHAQEWLNDKIAAAGYQLTGYGQCLGITYMATQAFFLDELAYFNERLNWIHDLPEDYFKNDFKRPRKEIRTLERRGDWVSASMIRAQLTEIKAFFEGVVLYSSAEKHADWFGEDIPEQLALEKTMAKILPERLLNSKENQPAYITSFFGPSAFQTYTPEDLDNFLATIGESLLEESFVLHFKSSYHILGLFYDAKHKKWFHVQPDSLPGEKVHALDLLAPIILSDFGGADAEQLKFKIELYAQEKNKKSIEMKLNTLQTYDVWSQRYSANPLKKGLSLGVSSDVIEHQRFEWFEAQLKELDEEKIVDILIDFNDFEAVPAFFKKHVPKDASALLIDICLRNISDTYKLLYAVSVGDDKFCTTLIHGGVRPAPHTMEKIKDEQWRYRNPVVNSSIKELMIQHYPIYTDADIECLYEPCNLNPGPNLVVELIKKYYAVLPEKWLMRALKEQDHKLLQLLLQEEANVTEAVLETILEDKNMNFHLDEVLHCFLRNADMPRLDPGLLNKIFLLSFVSETSLINLLDHNQRPDADVLHKVLLERKSSLNKESGFGVEARKLRFQALEKKCEALESALKDEAFKPRAGL